MDCTKIHSLVFVFLGTNGFAVRVVDKPKVLFKASVK